MGDQSFVTVNGGVRYAYERIVGDQTLAPRVDVSIRPFENGRTVVKGGIGRFYDALPLNAADFDRQQSRRITDYGALGNATGPRSTSTGSRPAGCRRRRARPGTSSSIMLTATARALGYRIPVDPIS